MTNKNLFNSSFPFDEEKIKILKKIKQECSDLQLAWLSGYFWNFSNNTNFLPKKPHCFDELNNSKKLITIISASQTGNAKLLSKRLNKYLISKHHKTVLINASDYNFKKINFEKIIILIISTQGEGEPPEEALSFYKFIMSKKAPKLNNLYYSIFGLGDVSYDLFCQSGKDFDKRFSELGAKCLISRLDADIEYELNYLEWSKNLLLSLNKVSINFSSSVHTINNSFKNIQNAHTKYNPTKVCISENQKITGRNSIKDVRHIELDIKNIQMNYTPGDAIGIWYQNSDALIEKILKALCINDCDTVKVKDSVITIVKALKKYFDITTNTKNIIKQYSNIIKSQFLKKILSSEIELKNYIIQTPLVKMIHDHPSRLSSQDLISFLRPLQPRLYSISSSQLEVRDEIHITVEVIKKFISRSIYLGGASGYLSNCLKTDDIVTIFLEKNNNFRLPKDKNTSIIMIGSGTGIAPFRSFMQHRDNDGSTGKNWIFFGNPNFTEDFLYQVEWQRYLKRGLLSKMSLAWSRDQKNKIYIQDKIKENSKEIWEWIQNGAQLYICGNASKMAKDVEQSLINVIQENSHMDLEKSHEFLDNLRLNQRYQRDVY